MRLILLMGQTVPLPASPDLLQAISKIEVTNDVDAGDGFQISLTMSKDKPPDYSLLQGGTFDPFTRVIIGVILGVIPQVLIDGVITHHQFTPSEQPGMSTLTVTGRDVSAMM
ncbi:MAG TPA: hypothetical protein VJX67_14070, partial [Blastocatellia bacterium]|nr:hypothetical protein [Blastocatellia bacterium]